MSDLHKDTPSWLQQIRSKYNDERFHQLNGLLNSYVSGVWSYLLAVNGGGAAGMLAFIGGKDEIAQQRWPYLVLATFVLGLVLIGFAHACMVHKAQALIDNWNGNMSKYWKNEIAWSYLMERDHEVVSHWAKAPWVLGWLSLALFVAGIFGAAYGFKLFALVA